MKLAGQETITPDEVHIVIHNPKTSQMVRVQTGPEGTEIHLGERI